MAGCASGGGGPAARYLGQVETAMMIALGAALALALLSAAADSLAVAGLCLAALLRASILAAALGAIGKPPARRAQLTRLRGWIFLALCCGLLAMAGVRWAAPGWPNGAWVAASAAGALAVELGLRRLLRRDAPLAPSPLDWTAGAPMVGALAGLALELRGDGRADLIAAAAIGLWCALEAVRALRGGGAADTA